MYGKTVWKVWKNGMEVYGRYGKTVWKCMEISLASDFLYGKRYEN
jgi:hypothetical protein